MPSGVAFRRKLLWIAAAGLLLRVAVVLTVPTQPTSDFWSYYHRGLNLAEHGRYEAIPGRADATYPPLYSMLLAVAFLGASGQTLLAGKLLNCLLGVATILLGALLARRLGGDRAGILAAGFFAFFPRALLLPCLLASENLFSPLLLAVVLIVLAGARTEKARRLAAACGVAVALAALTRTVGYYLGGLWFLAALVRRKKLRTALAETLLVLAVQHAVMLPWALRNEARVGRFTFLNTAGAYGLFVGNNPRADGLWYDARKQLEEEEPGVLAKGDLAISEASDRAAWRWMRENPGRAAALYFKKFGIIFAQSDLIASFAISARGVEPPKPGIDVLPGPHFLKAHLSAVKTLLSVAGWLAVLLGVLGYIGLLGKALSTRSAADLVPALVLPAAALYVPVISALIAVNGRYRWPVEDLILPVAAFAVVRTFERIKAGRKLRTADSAPRPPAFETGGGLARFEWAVLLIAAAILAYQLFLPPIVGLADSGDFAKIMGQVGLQYQTEDFNARYFGYVNQKYDVGPPWWASGYRTSELLFAAAARFYANGIARHGTLDIRVLGALHALLFLGGLGLLLVGSRGLRPGTRVAFAALLVFLFTDVGYTALDNSLYSGTASFLFLFLLSGVVLCLASGRSSRTLCAAYWIAALAFVTSKPQESVQAPLLAVLAIFLAREGRGPARGRASGWLAAALFACGVLYYFQTPLQLKTEALYNALFLQLLPSSPTPRADLEELGLPASWMAYNLTHAYMPKAGIRDPGFRDEFVRRVGYRRLLGFHFRHPDRSAKLLQATASQAFVLRQGYLGNFTMSAGGKPRERSRAFGVWSAWKARLGPSGPWLLPLFWTLNLAGAIAILLRSQDPQRRCLAAAVAVLIAMSIVELFVCSLADALADVARHLHAFNAMTDLCLIADVLWLASSAVFLARAFRRGGDLAPPLEATATAG
jgi:4-amino-4-deoxy-L-arabinose transferase-like glycosyltransferase